MNNEIGEGTYEKRSIENYKVLWKKGRYSKFSMIIRLPGDRGPTQSRTSVMGRSG
jgi:hypothetical protein